MTVIPPTDDTRDTIPDLSTFADALDELALDLDASLARIEGAIGYLDLLVDQVTT